MADNETLERRTTRRDVLLLGASGLVTLVGFGCRRAGAVVAAHPSVPLSTPALEEGPFWVGETGAAFHRSDLRANLDGTNVQSGLPLHLEMTVSHVRHGVVTPLPNAFVYLWSVNALGVYSDEAQERTARETYLRGYQVTDARGRVRFLTLYPGWYGGRTVHIHARVRTYPQNDPARQPSSDFETQLFFDDAVTDHVLRTVSPYNQRRGRDTTNRTDHVYIGAALDGTRARDSGALTTLHVAEDGGHARASFHMVLDLSKHARPGMPPGGFGGPPPGPPPGGFGGPPPGPPPDGFGGPPPPGD
ncbi:MAG: hypothetical protein JO250_16825 [Armatimonadetes bacterium]|nr:hypothetical protein [Armatimonadota bacterium]